MHPAFSQTDHRPWPCPEQPWTWRQSWCDLLFAHWPVPVEQLRPHIPRELEVQSFDGTGWVGVVPFRMEGVTRRPMPPMPWLSAFPELNLRTYVTHGSKPGVWFFSLDAGNSVAVWAARRWFGLPYFRADMSCTTRDGTVHYTSQRRDDAHPVRFDAEYAPTGEPAPAGPGTLDHFLTERYCLYGHLPDGRLYRGEVHHHPWPLQPATLTFRANELGRPWGLSLDGTPARLHFSRRLDVALWSPKVIEDDATRH